MKSQVSIRFWMTSASALATLGLAVITVVWQNWIEIVFRLDPDHGNGSLERWVLGVAAVLCLTSLLLAAREWQRARPLEASVNPGS